MARSESPRCDVALWDLEQTLLNPIRDQLSQPRHDRTGVLQADIGAWRSRRVAVLSLIETDALKKALHGFEAAHHPRLTLFVATASAREGAHSLGDVVLAKRLIEASSEPLVTSTDWMTPTLEKQSSFKLDDDCFSRRRSRRQGESLERSTGFEVSQTGRGSSARWGNPRREPRTAGGRIRPGRQLIARASSPDKMEAPARERIRCAGRRTPSRRAQQAVGAQGGAQTGASPADRLAGPDRGRPALADQDPLRVATPFVPFGW